MKPLDEFGIVSKKRRDKYGNPYRRGICRECHSAGTRSYYKENSEQCKVAMKRWYKENRERSLERRKQWYKENREESLEYQKRWRKENPEKARAQCKRWREENKEKMYEISRRYYLNNKQKVHAYTTKYAREHVQVRIAKSLRSRLSHAVKNAETKKVGSTMGLAGCTLSKLKQHLEGQFQEGMTWDNYGFYGWHIDHIKPCAAFDMTNEEEQRACFHYTNLQPLWAAENLSKNDTWEEVESGNEN